MLANNTSKTRITLSLILLVTVFVGLYHIMLALTQDQNLSIFSSLFITLLLLFLSVFGYLDDIRNPLYQKSTSHREATDRKTDNNPATDLIQYDQKDQIRLKYVLNASNEGLWEWNMRTGEITFSSQCIAILGIQAQGYTFEDFENSILEEDKSRVLGALNALIEKNRPYDMEFRIKRPDGSTIWVWDRCGVAEYQNGRPVWLIGLIQDITEKKQSREQIHHLAYYDSLTQLPNRTLLKQKLQQVIHQEHPKGQYELLLTLDLSRFKLLNDTYGHHIGDQLLTEVGKRLSTEVSNKGTVSRLGGDEFVILVPCLGITTKLATAYAQKFSERLSESVCKPYTLKHRKDIEIDYTISANIGGIIFTPAEADVSRDDLLRLADLALYKAKSKTGTKIRVFNLDSLIELDKASQLQKSIHQAMSDDEFCIYLQPKYNANQEMIGAESLMRWNHPQMGVLSPKSFLDIANETNLIIPLGDKVLTQSCEVLRQLQSSSATAHLTVSVNLSAKQIWQLDFVEKFSAIIQESRIDATKLILEVAESVFREDLHDAVDKLAQIKKLGVKLSLDDFGTGCSSLSCFVNLPIDEIKIDRSYIKKIVIDQQAYRMSTSLVAMAQNFQLDVVLVGVETKAQFDLLKENKEPVLQGFYLELPLSVSHFLGLANKL